MLCFKTLKWNIDGIGNHLRGRHYMSIAMYDKEFNMDQYLGSWGQGDFSGAKRFGGFMQPLLFKEADNPQPGAVPGFGSDERDGLVSKNEECAEEDGGGKLLLNW